MNTLLTPAKAAEFLGVPTGTLAQWRSQRRGPPYIKLEGRLVRYRHSDLEKYLSQRAVETNLTANLPTVRGSAIEKETIVPRSNHAWSSNRKSS
jgi:excisionase family DNA binding protein